MAEAEAGEWLTLSEAAALAGVSRGVTHRAASRGDLPHAWPSSAGRLFARDDVLAWKARREAAAMSDRAGA